MTNYKAQMPNEVHMLCETRVYDLEERTALFAEKIIDFVKTLSRNSINNVLIGQIIRSSTSIGANYMEADGAESKKDFRHKIALCKKESKETKHWLRMIVVAAPELKEEARILWREANELNLIFNAITRKINQKRNNFNH